MKKRTKKNVKILKPFNIGAYELHNNGLYRQKIIPDKKKNEKLKRKKVDIREYQPLFFNILYIGHSFKPTQTLLKPEQNLITGHSLSVSP